MEWKTTSKDGRHLVARTVLDLRSDNPKYLCQTLLLAASWHKHAACDTGLEVLTIGTPQPALANFLQSLDAHQACIEPGRNDVFSRHSNKIQGAGPDPAGRRVLLLDNDTCFLGRPAQLTYLPATAIVAAEAGNARVSDAQWHLIRQNLGLPLLRREWTPLNQRIAASIEKPSVGGERWIYLNSGVILFPSGLDHQPAWQSQQRAINDYFVGHPLASDAVTTSDQAGFASSVSTHGDFAWLPPRFNYRPPCFCLGLEATDRIVILHFTADLDNAGRLGMAERINAYWHQRILARIDRLPTATSMPDRDWRRAQAVAAMEKVMDIVREYDLDTWLAVVRRSRDMEAATT